MFTNQHKPHLEDDCPPVVYAEPYLPKHKDELLALLSKRFKDVGVSLDLQGEDEDLEDIEWYWKRPGGEFVVLIKDEHVVGSLAVRPLKEEGRAEFDWFYIAPEYENKGYSAPLYRWALEWCLKRNIKIVELWTGQARERTHHLYKNLGFVHNGVRKIVRRDPEYCLLYFELVITPSLIERLRRRFDRLP